jgi:hypothetical protein
MKSHWTPERLSILQRIAKAADNNRHGKTLGWSAAMESCKKEVKLLGITDYTQLAKAWSKQSRRLDGYCTACGLKPYVTGKTMCKGCLKRIRESVTVLRKKSRH